MSACEDKELLLHGLLDGELDAANTLACEIHLRECSGCAAEFERLLVLRSRLKVQGVAFEAPPGLRERVSAALRAGEMQSATSVRSVPSATAATRPPALGARLARNAFVPWAMAASVVALAAALAFVLLFQMPARGITDELVAGHVRSLLATHLVDVATSDRHVVKPWFAGKVDFAPPVTELADKGFPLVGGRLDYINGRVVAAVVYRRRQHIINVFVWPAGAAGPATAASRRDGYNVMGWKQGGLQFYAVSDVDAADLQQLRAAFSAQAGG
jgi:anti-sigma factor RsiW